MTHQSEQQLENTLISQLQRLGFTLVDLSDTEVLTANLKTQLEKFNRTTFSNEEFLKILNHLNRGDRYQKAKTLRDRYVLNREEGSTFWVRFFNTEKWCQNEYQVTHQLTQNGKYENRYDDKLMING